MGDFFKVGGRVGGRTTNRNLLCRPDFNFRRTAPASTVTLYSWRAMGVAAVPESADEGVIGGIFRGGRRTARVSSLCSTPHGNRTAAPPGTGGHSTPWVIDW